MLRLVSKSGSGSGGTSRRKPRAVRGSLPATTGWRTTDAEEIALRRERAGTEPMRIVNLEPNEPVFSSFRVTSASGAEYRVEIRSLLERENSCTCPDFRTNGLGTCKHLEAVLARLVRKDAARAARARGGRSARPEVFLRRAGDPEVALALPATCPQRAKDVLAGFFDFSGRLVGDPTEAIPALVRALGADHAEVRVDAEVLEWAEDRRRRATRESERDAFAADLRAGRRSLDFLRLPLYPYQVEGMLHLAFGERALLGDEMGLGKTAQAIAACELLRAHRGVERVLVVSPVSLKAEWEEQIEKFARSTLRLVGGPKPARLAAYEAPTFYTIVNYEQAVRDVAELNRRLRPDVIVLDEAQRIKNWNTKTARTVKRLASRFAFVLTGTPLENRIDEVYSIVEFLDPQIFGPLFRFNREFYELDERGRAVGYRNLEELRRRIRPLLLRRRKDEVEDDLPDRVVNNFFVPMSAAQVEPYEEHRAVVARLLAMAKKRPLRREEHERLQRRLACMRMLCDTPFILHPESRECPKLAELEAVLADLDVRRSRKAVVFSEWERMLELARGLARRMGIGFAWHTGSVPQARRREEIRRFKSDPGCRLLLSTDSGGLGLNLQTASVVVNLDLPWNPARLEQRIARAWRKHQTRAVHVVNLISENTIEHQMLGTLEAKRRLADAILDGRGDLAELRMPSARQSFLDRLRLVMETRVAAEVEPRAVEPPSPLDRLRLALGEDGRRLVDLRALGDGDDTRAATLVIVDGEVAADRVAAAWDDIGSAAGLPREVELVDVATMRAIERLARRGLVPALASVTVEGAAPEETARREAVSRALRAEAERKVRMAAVLRNSGFEVEAVGPTREAAAAVLRAEALRLGLDAATGDASGADLTSLLADGSPVRSFLRARGRLREADGTLLTALRVEACDAGAASDLVEAGAELVQRLGAVPPASTKQRKDTGRSSHGEG